MSNNQASDKPLPDKPLPDNAQSPEDAAAEELVQQQPAGDRRSSDATQQSLDDLRQQLDDAQNQALRAQAELENFRKRVRREADEQRKYAVVPLLQDLLIVLDNLQRAIDAARTGSSDQGLLSGVEMVADELSRVLERHGCTPVAGAGAPFDPNVHEALAQQPSDEQPAGNVLLVHQTGFRLHDRVVRPAQVIVSTGPPAEDEQPAEAD